jgi:surfeit locus 1 family protein
MVTGLLRLSEPGGGFLRPNDPRSDRWYSRDVAAIAASRGLDRVAPYFIDLERAPDEAGLPIGGLTVVTFPNNHLVYAVTWGILALMAAAGTAFLNVQVLQTRRWSRRAGPPES